MGNIEHGVNECDRCCLKDSCIGFYEGCFDAVNNWRFDEHESDWRNTASLIAHMGYKPRIPMKSFIANILLHYEVVCEEEERDVSMEEYLCAGILGGEEGRLQDFDFE